MRTALLFGISLCDLYGTGANNLQSAVIDTAKGFAYFGTGTYPGIVVKINVGCTNVVLAKSASSFTASAGDTLTYTLTLVKYGRITATLVTLTDTLPVGVSYISASPGCVPIDRQVVCDVGTLASGSTRQVTLTVSVASTATEWLTNTAVVTANEASLSVPLVATVRTLLNPKHVCLPLVEK